MAIRIGVQMFTLRSLIKTPADMEEAFRRCHEMGAQCVQALQVPGGSPALLRELSQRYALPICTIHAQFSRLQNDIDRLAEEYLDIGCTAVGIAMMPVQYQRKGLEATAAFVEQLNEAGRKLQPYGLHLTYHNHSLEFRQQSGQVIYDYMLAHTEPYIRFTPDVYWIKVGGHDPVEVLQKLNGRAKVLHLKDYKKKVLPLMKEIGAGTLDFPAILRCAEEIGVEDAVVELDFTRKPYRSVEHSLRYLDSIYK